MIMKAKPGFGLFHASSAGTYRGWYQKHGSKRSKKVSLNTYCSYKGSSLLSLHWMQVDLISIGGCPTFSATPHWAPSGLHRPVAMFAVHLKEGLDRWFADGPAAHLVWFEWCTTTSLICVSVLGRGNTVPCLSNYSRPLSAPTEDYFSKVFGCLIEMRLMHSL